MILKIYIACSLTHVPRDFFDTYVKTIHDLASHLREFEIKYALVNSDPQLKKIPLNEKAKYCYLWDRKMVEEADVIIAEASFPSIGLGIELQIAETRNIPVILLYNENQSHKALPASYTNPDKHEYNLQIGEGYVSLMALGLPNILKIIPYTYFENCIKDISVELNKLEILRTKPEHIEVLQCKREAI